MVTVGRGTISTASWTDAGWGAAAGAVAVGGPADGGAEVTVDRVAGGRGEGRGLGEEDLGIVRRGRDRHGRRRLVADLEGDLGRAREVGEVGGPRGDRVHPDREAAA